MRALITGVNSLVNKAMLAKLVEMGFEVTAHYHSDNDITELLKKEFADEKVKFVQADFSSKESFLNFCGESMDEKYDVLINAAVYYAEDNGTEAQLEFDAWQKNFAVNTTVPGVLMAHGNLAVNEGGVIVNISSTYGQAHMGDTAFTMYSASKAALDSLTMAYAKILSAHKIRVAGIAPGWVESSWNVDMSASELKEMLVPQLTGKLVSPEEIADLMETVITNKSINATTFVIDGGLSAPIIK